MTGRTTFVVGMILMAALSRLIQHEPNFTSTTAMALFGGAYLATRRMGVIVPLAALLISDAALEVLTRAGLTFGWMAKGQGFYQGMWAIYATTALVAVLGFTLRERKTVPAIGAATLGGSLLFFLLTNFAVWAGWMYPQQEYPANLQGLLLCYWKALPFFHWSLLGDGFFVFLLFGGFALAEQMIPKSIIAFGQTRPNP
jgi:hypothetical protein